MLSFSQSSVSFQNSRGTKRKWVPEEDVALVACIVDLYNVGTYNADTRFKTGYLNELERMLEKVLPHAILKAKLNLESMIRTLKRDWAIVYDMLRGKDNSGFDRATRKDAQTAADIVEEIDAEDMDVSATQSQPLKPTKMVPHFQRRNKKISDGSEQISTSITNAAMLLRGNIQTVGLELSRSIASEKVLQESAPKLYSTLCKVEGLTKDERYCALSTIPYHPTQMLLFFSLPSSVRLEW
ncbi:hypothetical protein Gogos_021668, partial [Gossypium gossypioides]|nr:hypothetical protein [Gossypium gossypioides]